MMWPRFQRVLVLCVITLLSGGCFRAESVVQSRLGRLLETNGFTLYTPFRTTDYPGTVFVLTANHKGRWTEVTLAEFDRTFTVPPSRLFDPHGQEVDFADELSQSYRFDAGVGLELVSLVLKPETSMKYVKHLRIRFNDPKLVHRMTLERLADARFDVRDSVKQALSDLKEKGQLSNVYIVLETVMANSVEIELALKDEYRGKLSQEQVKSIVGANGSLETDSAEGLTVRSTRPVIIGYKALPFPETMLRNEVSVPYLGDMQPVGAREINRIKRK